MIIATWRVTGDRRLSNSRQQLPVGECANRGLPHRVLQRDFLQDERLQPRRGHAEVMQVRQTYPIIKPRTHKMTQKRSLDFLQRPPEVIPPH